MFSFLWTFQVSVTSYFIHGNNRVSSSLYENGDAETLFYPLGKQPKCKGIQKARLHFPSLPQFQLQNQLLTDISKYFKVVTKLQFFFKRSQFNHTTTKNSISRQTRRPEPWRRSTIPKKSCILHTLQKT